MIVTRVIGDCPSCGTKDSFGNVLIRDNLILRGCKSCRHRERIYLPDVKKKILYLDQFVFSSAFRGGDKRFVDAMDKISKLSALQLLAAPYSSVHEDETHQWGGHNGKSSDELMEFIKHISHGLEYEPDYEVEETQIIEAFTRFLANASPEFELKEGHILGGEVHEWDDYIRIDVGRYVGDVELIRETKRNVVALFTGLFDEWRESDITFEENVMRELQGSSQSYIGFYAEYVARIGRGDFDALLDAPIVSHVVQSMMYCFPKDIEIGTKFKKIAEFFSSEYFFNIPYQKLSARIHSVIRHQVRTGSYTNRENAIKKFSGYFYDLRHIALYAPYCDGFIMDNAMAAVVKDPRIALEKTYGVKVFSLNNWDELLEWLDEIERGMSEEHKRGIELAYP